MIARDMSEVSEAADRLGAFADLTWGLWSDWLIFKEMDAMGLRYKVDD